MQSPNELSSTRPNLIISLLFWHEMKVQFVEKNTVKFIMLFFVCLIFNDRMANEKMNASFLIRNGNGCTELHRFYFYDKHDFELESIHIKMSNKVKKVMNHCRALLAIRLE